MTIGLLGSPGCGKTLLASMLEKKIGAKAVYELEFDFPNQIFENLELGKDLFETILWFRNKQLISHKLMLELASKQKFMVTDSTLYQYQMYIDLFIKNDFYREILIELGQQDVKSNEALDLYIYISASQDTILDLLNRKDPSWPLFSDKNFRFLSQMAYVADNFIKKNKNLIPNLLEIRHEDFDFSNETDLDRLLKLIQNWTNNSNLFKDA